MSLIYVSGHRNPDADAIAAAIGYAEVKQQLDPGNQYVPVRLGELNAQTEWLLARAGAEPPELLPHVLLRVRDVMRKTFPVAEQRDPVRDAGVTMARESLDLLPILDDDRALAGVITEQVLARRYIRESREPSRLEVPTAVATIAALLDGEVLAGHEREVTGRIWVLATNVAAMPLGMEGGDVAVVGDRPDAQRRAVELGAGLLVTTSGIRPPQDVAELALERGTALVRSPLDTYVSARLIMLATPCRAMMDAEPLTVGPDDLLDDVADNVKDVGYRAAVAVDVERRPLGILTRSDLLNPQPRRVLLVDHAEQAQSVPGIERAEVVEILDHHAVGSIETTVPVVATFDPVGATATLVSERFRQNGLEARPATATLLLGAILSDTVILSSPTTTERDRTAVEQLARALGVDAVDFGREMFKSSSEVARVPAEQLLARDAKSYQARGGRTIRIAQVETVGGGVLERTAELAAALRREQQREGYAVFALMITDILSKGTTLLVAGDLNAVERAFGPAGDGGVIDLPGVMSRKKQVAPKLLAATPR